MTPKQKNILFYGITLLVPLVLLVLLEVALRYGIAHYHPALYEKLNTYRTQLADEADPITARRIGHPFALFVLNYKYPPVSKPYHINSLGYTDDEFEFKKEPGEYRILAFGGSTTVGYTAWPNQLEAYLNAHYKGTKIKKFTVYNFGVESYTSMQSVISLAMHGVDYKPDLIIVHDGYNDTVPMTAQGFRNDYAHVYKSWHIENVRGYPWIYSRILRHSILATLAGFYGVEGGKLRDMQSGEYIPGVASASSKETSTKEFWERPKYVFERNLNSLRLLAEGAGAHMMLLTGPYANGDSQGYDVPNQVIHTFAARYKDVLLCDLQAQSAELKPHFIDSIHVNNAGQAVKGRIIGEAVLAALKQ